MNLVWVNRDGVVCLVDVEAPYGKRTKAYLQSATEWPGTPFWIVKVAHKTMPVRFDTAEEATKYAETIVHLQGE
jgi:hypothetical protein